MKKWQIFLMLGLFVLVLSSFDSAEAAASPVAIVLQDDSSGNIMEHQFLVTELTLYNTDSKYRAQEIYLSAVWPSGIAWEFFFVDVNFDEFEGNLVKINKGAETTIYALIVCEGECSAGDTNVVQIYGQTDPEFYNYDGNVTDTCGSDDCENDSTSASYSSNVTNTITVTLSAWAEYHSEVTCDAVSNTGDNKVYPSNTTQWGYTLTNTGWNSDTYQFTPAVTSADGHNVDYWSVDPGMTDGKELTGQSNTSSTAVHTAESSISIIPATNATSGIYNVELIVISNNGAPDSGCAFDVVIPAEEIVEEESEDEPEEEVVEEEPKDESKEEVIEDEEIPEEVPSISLISSIAAIGIIALRRRY